MEHAGLAKHSPVGHAGLAKHSLVERAGLAEHSPTEHAGLAEYCPAEHIGSVEHSLAGCTFLTTITYLTKVKTLCPRIIVRVSSHGAGIRQAIHVLLGLAAFVDPLPIMARKRGSPKPVAWPGLELNSATSSSWFRALTDPELYSARDSARLRAQLDRGLSSPRVLLGPWP